MATFIVSQKGNRKLVLGEFLFTKKRNGANGKEIWVCEERTCQSGLHTKDDVVVQAPTAHNHAPKHGKAKVEAMRSEMKKRAQITEEGTRQIVHQSQAKLPRSNNYTESWHNAFNGTVNIAHPSVARLARKLQQEQHATMILRAQHATGQPPAKKRKKYIRINEALTTMVDAYDRTDAITYLKNIARVLNINVI